MSYVYWVYDKTCIDIISDGYIGVTDNINERIRFHMSRNPRIPKENELSYKIIFEGTPEECFLKEEEYRPSSGIGWNSAKGGAQGWVSEFTHNEITRQKLRDAWTPERRESASLPRPEHAEKLLGKKRPAHSDMMIGENNPMFGRTHTDEAKRKISESSVGKPAWNKGIKQPQELVVCPHCNKKGGIGNMTRYHFDNCKLKDMND